MMRPGTSNMSKKLSDRTKPIITDTSPLLLVLMGLYDKNAISDLPTHQSFWLQRKLMHWCLRMTIDCGANVKKSD